MGKFSGMLLLTDYDNTLHFTAETLRTGGPLPPIHPRNIEAIRRWMAEGGAFSVATGRALAAFRRQAEQVPVNAPVIVDNGGGIYDLAAERYLVKNFLGPGALDDIAGVLEQFPGISLELYYDGGPVQVMRETDWNRQHAMLTGLAYETVDRLKPRQEDLVKALLVAEKASLEQARAYMEDRGFREKYELIFSSSHLLELTAKGADKGAMALRLKEMCGCKKLFCAGDHANDLPMLRAADRAFAPANAIAEVLGSGATVVCHCLQGAIADAVEILEREG